ncbi:uncharacterized protein [Typha angustifolia]|uniref:uncharacterized protein isoform X2 n=1 Tax=Typha angustifolia TaxID=59011 RepID=UPI003C2F5D25
MRIKKTPKSQLLIKSDEEDNRQLRPKNKPHHLVEPITCFSFLKLYDCSKPTPADSPAGDRWRAAQRASALRLERRLRARFALDDLVDAELARLRLHYHHHRHGKPSSSPREVSRLLFPPWNPPLFNAALSWLGDWRPSTILALIPSLAAASPSSSALTNLSPRAHRSISEAVKRLRAHEAVIESEVGKYQARCAVRMGSKEEVMKEMGKMETVVRRANGLRYRALEVAVNDVLERTQAAEFLAAFAGVEVILHRTAERWRARVGPLAITIAN